MTAEKLIEYLQTVPSNTHITIWCDGNRLQIHPTDPFDFWDDAEPVADINVKIEEPQIKEKENEEEEFLAQWRAE